MTHQRSTKKKTSMYSSVQQFPKKKTEIASIPHFDTGPANIFNAKPNRIFAIDICMFRYYCVHKESVWKLFDAVIGVGIWCILLLAFDTVLVLLFFLLMFAFYKIYKNVFVLMLYSMC